MILLLAVTGQPEACPLTKDEAATVQALNKYRADRKLPPLTVDPILLKVARHRVAVYDHHAYGCWCPDEAARCGFHGSVTDNLAQGYESGADAVGDGSHGWGDERPGHTVGHDMQQKGYKKINGQWVNQHFDLVGVAHQGKNWIAVFGRKDK